MLSADKRRRNKLHNSSIPIEVLSKCRSFSQDRLDDELAVLCVARKIDFRLVSILLAMKHRNPEVLLLCKEKFDTEKLFPLVKDLDVPPRGGVGLSRVLVQTKAFRFDSLQWSFVEICVPLYHTLEWLLLLKVSDHFLRYSL